MNKKIDLIALLCLLGILIFTLFHISDAIILINNEYLVKDIELKFKDLIWIHSGFLNFGIILCIYAIFFKTINYKRYLVLFLIAFLSGMYAFIDHTLHPYLRGMGFYDFLMRGGQTVSNPQYTRLLIYFIVITLLGFILLFKKQRNLFRFFSLFISGSIVFTVMLFHVAMPMGYFSYLKNQEMNRKVTELNQVSVGEICDVTKCIMYDEDWNILFKDAGLSDNFEISYEASRKNVENILNNQPDIDYVRAELSTFDNSNFDYALSIMLRTENGYMWIIDDELIKEYSRIAELVFAILALMANTMWIFLFGLMMVFHQNKKIYKLKG